MPDVAKHMSPPDVLKVPFRLFPSDAKVAEKVIISPGGKGVLVTAKAPEN
jgi:hypothetical protein